ncbi:MAG: hypothetical protein ABEK00_03740 [Candidatus Nanohaloarchaea archaeon]
MASIGALVISVKNDDYNQLEITGLNISAPEEKRFRNTSTVIEPGNSKAVGLPGYTFPKDATSMT